MGLTNREKLEIIARAKKDNYTGNYLDLFNQAAAEGRQKMPEVRRAGGFIYDVNKPDKSTYVDARSGYGFPTTYEHGGPHAEYPPYDSLTDFQKQNIKRDEYGYTTIEMGVDGREFVPGPGGTLDSMAMHNKSVEVRRLMTPYNVHMDIPRPDGSFDYQTNEEAKKEAQRLNQENPLDNFYSEPVTLNNNLYSHNFGRNEIDNASYKVGRETYDGKDIFYPGDSEEDQSQNLAKLREGHEGIQPHPSFNPELRMKTLQNYKAYLMKNEGDSERLAMLDSEIANLESGNNPDYYELGKTSHNMIFGNYEKGIKEDTDKYINYYDTDYEFKDEYNEEIDGTDRPLYSEGTRIPNYNRPVGKSIPNKPIPVPPRIEPRAAGPIPINLGKPELQKATMPEFPDTGPTKSDLFFEGLENANTFKNRPDKMSDRAARNVRGKDEVSTEYIFSDDNPYAPQKGEYFMSEANSRGKRKYDGDLNAARKWERENGLGVQSDLKGYDVGPDIQKHGGFSRMFKQDFSKYINKKEHGGSHDDTTPLPIGNQQSRLDNTRVPIINLNEITSNEMPSNEVAVNPPVNERRQFINFLKEQEAGPEFMRAIDSAVKKPDGTYYKAFEDGKFYPYFQGKEKEATIGYGRKAANVLEKYNKGITDQQALDFMNKDIDRSLYLAEEFVERNKESPFYGDVGSFGRLDSNTQYLLSDYTYNVGKLSKFPNFTKAVLTNDPVGMEEEYIRVEDKSTNIPLKRNKPFYDLYLKPRIDKLKQNNK